MKWSVGFLACLLALFSLALAEVYLKETFSDSDWEKRWIQSKHENNLGRFQVSAGKFYADEIESRGLQTSQDAKFYAISSKLDKIIDNFDKDLVIQFSVKHEQNIDCGGGYVKLLPPDFDALNFKGESIYNIMFGPDICGVTRTVHVILRYKGENKQIKKSIVAPSDQLTHLYTLILKPDHTYKVLIDNKEEASGTLEEDFDLLPLKEIPDPDAKKPEDWADDAQIPDPDDHKPEDWVDLPATIPDPDAQKPDDWDDEMDGEWEAPHISNPDYKGEWKPKMIDNPKYKGPWSAPLIINPEYTADPQLHAYKTEYIGFDLWQVKSGTIFDNIIVTDDVETVEVFVNETFIKFRDAEKEAKRLLDESEKKEADETDSKVEEPADELNVQEEEDDIIDLDVKLDDSGKVTVSDPDPNFDLKVDGEKQKPLIIPEKAPVEEIKIDDKESTSSITPTSTKKAEASPETTLKDEIDQLFKDLEEELGLPTRDEL